MLPGMLICWFQFIMEISLWKKVLSERRLLIKDALLIYEPSDRGSEGVYHESMSERTLLLNSPDSELGFPEVQQKRLQ